MSSRKTVAELVLCVKAFKRFSKTALPWFAHIPIYRKTFRNADGLTEVDPIKAISGE